MSEEVPFNFCGLQEEFSDYSKAKVAILPIPFDGTSTWGKGADKGPDALIDASRNMELYDIETDCEPYDVGIATCKPVIAKNPDEMVKKGIIATKKLLDDGKFVMTLGGEHSISVAPIWAHAEKYKNFSVLHLDAHTDMRDEYCGTKFNHACAMARAIEKTKNVVSVGIRSMDSGEFEVIAMNRKNGKKHDIFFAEDIHDNNRWMDKAISLLGKQVYISIDLDVFDPSIMPSTGTPEPGGMQWYQTIKFLRKVFERRQIIGIDIVELAPTKEKSSDFLAAKLAYKLIAYKYKINKPKKRRY